jgi:hypothetical protein
MSHRIIIIGHGGTGNRTAHDSFASSQIDWTPGHNLTPAQVQRRIERAERKLNEAEELLTGPAGEEAHVE